jgi:hypothetical protein
MIFAAGRQVTSAEKMADQLFEKRKRWRARPVFSLE